jgi:hypothetical protein|tara:strand:+ start:181 stop:393 length:213 start_codon:yes stop_codon:yes gene_type:complete
MDKPMTDYYKFKEPQIVCHNRAGSQNQQILHRLENDISKIQSDINSIKEDLTIIKNYVTHKKQKEDKAWF